LYQVRADIPFAKVRRLKAVAHSTLSSPRCTSTPYELITFSAKYSTAKSHIPIISRREKTQRDKRLKKMRGPARCQSGKARTDEQRDRETDPHLRHKGEKEREKIGAPPAPGARESGRGKPQLSRHVIPLAAVGPSLVRLSCFCSFQKISLLFYFSRRARGEVMWHDKGHRFATQLRIVRQKNQRYCRNIIDVRRIMKLCIHRPIENTASILFYLSLISLKIN
jgi:hypothetical protein